MFSAGTALNHKLQREHLFRHMITVGLKGPSQDGFISRQSQLDAVSDLQASLFAEALHATRHLPGQPLCHQGLGQPGVQGNCQRAIGLNDDVPSGLTSRTT